MKTQFLVAGEFGCGTCLYWAKNLDDIEKGLCARYPPQLVPGVDSINMTTVWEQPTTYKEWWCGEHDPIPSHLIKMNQDDRTVQDDRISDSPEAQPPETTG